jgi:hypothetical protein
MITARAIAANTIGGIVAAVLVLVLLGACVPVEPAPLPTDIPPTATPQEAEPTPTQEIVFINDNPDLALGSCWRVEFVTLKFGIENIKQCKPKGYHLYEQKAIGSYPIRVIHTGAGYYILPNGAHGLIGFTLPGMMLNGDYWLKVHFDALVEGEFGDYSVDAKANGVEIGKHILEGNGPNTAVFYLPGVRGAYSIDVYLNLVHPSATANSYITITSITVEKSE